MTAVAPLICAVPTMDVFWHSAAEASQNVTTPALTAEPPAVTAAVNVTVAGDATVLEESVRVVVVDTPAACAAIPSIATWPETIRPRQARRIAMRLQAERNSLPMKSVPWWCRKTL